MNKILIINILSVFLAVSYNTYAQTDFEKINKYAVPPTTAKFHEASFSEPELCTGKIKYDLPFYTFSLRDINIPISISYYSNGIKVKSAASRVGQEWVLKGGGAVTRKKKGSLTDYDDDYIPDPVGRYTKGWQYADSASYDGFEDGEPDIFIVNAPGLYSEFIITRGDEAFVLDGQSIKIEVETEDIDFPEDMISYGGISFFPYRTSRPDIKKIVIRNELGYKYTFDCLVWNAAVSFGPHKWEIISWNLTKIESPYGQRVAYNYDDKGGFASAPIYMETIGANASSLLTDEIYFEDTQGHVESSSLIVLNSNIRLKNIYSDETKIDFNYNYSRTDISGDSALSEILIKNMNDTIVKKVNLNYDYFTDGSTNTRLKLTDVEIKSPNNSNGDKYQFEYYSGDVPNRSSYEYDYSGFYNANNATDWKTKLYAYYESDLRNTVFLPFIKSGSYVSFDSNGADRSPSISAKNGMLKKITLPTGGYREFDFELNTWSLDEIPVPGLRLKKETLFDGYNYIQINYEYQGSVVEFPQMACLIKYANPIVTPMTDSERRTFVENYTARFSFDQINNEFFDGSDVLYKRVKKYQEGNGYTLYYYQVPSDPTLNFESDLWYIPDINPGSGYPFYVGESYKRRRGKLIEEDVIDENEKWSKVTAYKYKFVNFGYVFTTLKGNIRKEVNHNHDNLWAWYDVYCGKYVLTGKIESYPSSNINLNDFQFGQNYEYLNDENDTRMKDWFKIKTEYGYNNELLLGNISSVKSDGSIIITAFTYPKGINNGIYAEMADMNMLKYPIETIKWHGYGQTTHVLEGILNTYRSGAGSYVKDKTYFMNIESPLHWSSFDYFNGFTIRNYYTRGYLTVFNTYNGNGDITKYTSPKGIVAYYLWAYNSQYPVAKIESPDGLISIETIQLAINGLSLSGSDDKTAIDTDIGLIKDEISSSLDELDMLTLYTYKPLVGMTSQTSPDGQTIYYEYDDFGRLELTRDYQGNIIKRYGYHYANQQE